MSDFKVLSALIDDEDLDVDELIDVLSTPEGRDALRAFATARQEIRTADADPPPHLHDRLRRLAMRDRWSLLPRAFAAAAVLVLAVLGGWWAGRTADERAAGGASPPVVTRTLTFQRDVDWLSPSQ